MTSSIPIEDINYLAQQSAGQMNMILSGMTALMKDNNVKVEQMESQKWYQRMIKTIFGQNKATKEEIKQNHDKLNSYMAKAVSELYNRQCIDQKVILSLTANLNEVYDEHVQLKQIMGAFVVKLNEKIESIDNFHMLNAEIEQGMYSDTSHIIAVCKILSQMDRNCLHEERKMNILRRSMSNQNIIGSEEMTLQEMLLSFMEISTDDAGQVYLELSTMQGNFMADVILKMMDNYCFLSDMAKKSKNKAVLVQSIIEEEQLDPAIKISIEEVFEDFIDSKFNAFDCNISISAPQKNDKLEAAEKLFLDYKLDEAFSIFKELAAEGNGRAMYFLGEYYSRGYGDINKDDAEAEKWKISGRDAGNVLAAVSYVYKFPKGSDQREQAFAELEEKVASQAEEGDLFAQLELARIYKNRSGAGKNLAEAKKWFKKSAEQGYWLAMNYLGEVCYFEENDKENAVAWYIKAAEQGYAIAQKHLGDCYYFGEGVEEDEDKAAYWYKKAAEQGNEDAKKNLKKYFSNNVSKKDIEESEYLLNKNSEDIGENESSLNQNLEDADADMQFNIGNCYYFGDGVEENLEKAVYWYSKAAEQGNAEAQCCLGNCYYLGEGVEEDQRKAVYWYRKASEQGNAEAQCNLGNCYYLGEGVKKDDEKAVYWFSMSAEQGNAEAQWQLGKCYSLGEGIKQDEKKAVYWYLKSAEQNNDTAYYLLGICYFYGLGVKEDKKSAVYCYKKSAEQGNEDAQRELAKCYLYGDGVERDEIEAEYWFNKAKGNGFIDK